MINILFKFRFKKFNYSGFKSQIIHLNHARKNEQENLIKFLEQSNHDFFMRYDYSKEIDRRKMSLTNFPQYWALIKNSSDNKIIAATQFWTPSPFKESVIENSSPLAKVLQFFGLIPKDGEALKTLYFCNLSFDKNLTHTQKKAAFLLLYEECINIKKKHHLHLIAIKALPEDCYSNWLKSSVKFTIPMSLYSVSLDNQENLHKSPEFEIAFV